MLSSYFFSNNLILGIFPCKWSAVAGVSVLGVGLWLSLSSVPRALEYGRIAVLGPWGSSSTLSVLFGDIGSEGLRHMVGGQRQFFFSLVRVVCFLFLYSFDHRTVKFSSQ